MPLQGDSPMWERLLRSHVQKEQEYFWPLTAIIPIASWPSWSGYYTLVGAGLGKKLSSDGSVILRFGKLLPVTVSIIYMMLPEVRTVGSGVTDVEGAVQVIEKGLGTEAAAQQGRAKPGLHWEAGEWTSSSVDIPTLHLMPFLLENPATSNGLGMTYRLVYYSSLKVNFMVIKNTFFVECKIR